MDTRISAPGRRQRARPVDSPEADDPPRRAGATRTGDDGCRRADLQRALGRHEDPQVALHLLASQPHGTYVELFHPIRDPP